MEISDSDDELDEMLVTPARDAEGKQILPKKKKKLQNGASGTRDDLDENQPKEGKRLVRSTLFEFMHKDQLLPPQPQRREILNSVSLSPQFDSFEVKTTVDRTVSVPAEELTSVKTQQAFNAKRKESKMLRKQSKHIASVVPTELKLQNLQRQKESAGDSAESYSDDEDRVAADYGAEDQSSSSSASSSSSSFSLYPSSSVSSSSDESSSSSSSEDSWSENEHHSGEDQLNELFDSDEDQGDDADSDGENGSYRDLLPLEKKIWNKGRPFIGHSLAIIYAAARHLSIPLLLSDLIRWVATGRIPYMSSEIHRQDYTNYLNLKPLLLTRQLPSRNVLETRIEELMECLPVRLPPPEPRLVFSNFVRGLSLGDQFVAYCERLRVKYNEKVFNISLGVPKHQKKDIQLYFHTGYSDIKLMGFLVIVLKLCYAFDDSFQIIEEDLDKLSGRRKKIVRTRGISPLTSWLYTRLLESQKNVQRADTIDEYLRYCKKYVFSERPLQSLEPVMSLFEDVISESHEIQIPIPETFDPIFHNDITTTLPSLSVFPRPLVYNRYVVTTYGVKSGAETIHGTYGLLLAVLASYLYCTTGELHQEVRKIETVLFKKDALDIAEMKLEMPDYDDQLYPNDIDMVEFSHTRDNYSKMRYAAMQRAYEKGAHYY